jgi:hypothetical protein
MVAAEAHIGRRDNRPRETDSAFTREDELVGVIMLFTPKGCLNAQFASTPYRCAQLVIEPNFLHPN